MSASTDQIYELRRRVAEPTDARGYTNTRLSVYIERYPLVDALGRFPWRSNLGNPPELEVNPYWTATYDLNAAAADIWDEKASSLAENYDRDGASRSQAYEHAVKRAKYYRARRSPTLIEQTPYPYPVRESWVGNTDSN